MSSTVVDVIGVFGSFWEIANSSWLAMLVDSARKYRRHNNWLPNVQTAQRT